MKLLQPFCQPISVIEKARKSWKLVESAEKRWQNYYDSARKILRMPNRAFWRTCVCSKAILKESYVLGFVIFSFSMQTQDFPWQWLGYKQDGHKFPNCHILFWFWLVRSVLKMIWKVESNGITTPRMQLIL